ncbi:MAG: hypothetical protein NT137_00090 [Methanomassiliicoccales archaeon]|nr:hypothetical protein [Methanomassiliicoccales archaeon]
MSRCLPMIASVVLVAVLLVPGNASAASITSTFTTPEVRGVSASFGLVMDYGPQHSLVRKGDQVEIQFAPSPLPMSLHVNLLKLFSESGAPLPSVVTSIVNLTAGTGVWVVTIPAYDTPIGSRTITSFSLFQNIVFLDVNVVGTLQASLTSTSGNLDRTSLSWTEWGGEQVKMTVTGTESASVSASLSYAISCGYVLRFAEPIAYALSLIGQPSSYVVASFSLGTFPLEGTPTANVEVVAQTAPASDQTATILGVGGGAAVVGIAAGIFLGRKSRR